jgi:hypothetical protein
VTYSIITGCCCIAEDPENVDYDWFDVGVLDFDPETQEFFVQKCNKAGRVVDPLGNPVVDGGLGPDGKLITQPFFF